MAKIRTFQWLDLNQRAICSYLAIFGRKMTTKSLQTCTIWYTQAFQTSLGVEFGKNCWKHLLLKKWIVNGSWVPLEFLLIPQCLCTKIIPQLQDKVTVFLLNRLTKMWEDLSLPRTIWEIYPLKNASQKWDAKKSKLETCSDVWFFGVESLKLMVRLRQLPTALASCMWFRECF